MAPAHQSWIRENLTLVLFAVAVIAGFTVVGIDVANHNGPAPPAGATGRAGAGSSGASNAALTPEQIKANYTRPGTPTGRGGKDNTQYKSMGTYYCTHYYKFTKHDTITDWPDAYTACQGACDAIPTCNAFGLGGDKCTTYRGCISSAPETQDWDDYFFMNTREWDSVAFVRNPVMGPDGEHAKLDKLADAHAVCEKHGLGLCPGTQVAASKYSLCQAGWVAGGAKGYWMDHAVPGDNCGHAGWNEWPGSGDVSGAYCCKRLPTAAPTRRRYCTGGIGMDDCDCWGNVHEYITC